MEISFNDNGKKGAFYIEENGSKLAEMTFVWAGSNMIIDHTEVSKSLAGKGIGKQLVEKAVLMARENNFKIIPLCPFAKATFDKVKKYSDVLN